MQHLPCARESRLIHQVRGIADKSVPESIARTDEEGSWILQPCHDRRHQWSLPWHHLEEPGFLGVEGFGVLMISHGSPPRVRPYR